eukprot:2640449-Pyramimonas_sp.AAC.2
MCSSSAKSSAAEPMRLRCLSRYLYSMICAFLHISLNVANSDAFNWSNWIPICNKRKQDS